MKKIANFTVKLLQNYKYLACNIFRTDFDVLDLDLKNTWTNLLDSDRFYYNQPGMVLENYENLFQWSVKPLVTQLSLASSISLGQTMEL